MHERAQSEPTDLALVLDLDEARPASPWSRRLAGALAGVATLAVIALVAHTLLGKPHAGYAIQQARRGDLAVTATATGTLHPIDQVDIGTELSGTIRNVEVGFNDQVHVGQVLARLDTTRLEAQVLQSRAALDSAQASVEQARANLSEQESQLGRLQHVHEISGGKIPSAQELVAGQAAAARARAAEASAQAAVAQAKATLDVQQTDLSKAIIRSPIDGIVLTASVRPGQTVAASLQAPILFTLAKDLKRLELDLSVDEADIGRVKEGQSATFTVDAWPGRTFSGEVTQVRYGARTLGGVVTYETVLAVDNPDLSLRPGMTATAAIEVARVQHALLVPNAALRFIPPNPEDRRRSRPLAGLIPTKGEFDVGSGGHSTEGGGSRVWVVERGALAAVPVEVGASDGRWTEIVGGSIEEGAQLAVDASAAGD
jgi:HlyD family secretion protein